MSTAFWFFPAMGSLLLGLVIVAGVISRRWNRRRASLAEEATDPFDVLARELVHEIRNPLNSIGLHLQLLEEDFSELETAEVGEFQKRTRRIRSEVERLDQILADFRRFARLPPLSFKRRDICVLIEEVMEFTEPEAQRQNIKVVREIGNLPTISLDSDQFKQAFWNLVINAVQAMEDGGKLTVRAVARNGEVQIDVEDTGKGIDSTIKDKIFDLFFYTKEDGTGVGLAIVKRVIEGHGGRIRVESQPAHVTTFSIFLPVEPKTERR